MQLAAAVMMCSLTQQRQLQVSVWQLLLEITSLLQ
jgi:hypothetical protein